VTERAWRRSVTTLWRRTTTGVVLLPAEATEPVRLAGAAALVWDLLEEPTPVSEATELLSRACGEDPSGVRTEIEALLAELRRLGAADCGGDSGC
jgi:hypothetical protein